MAENVEYTSLTTITNPRDEAILSNCGRVCLTTDIWTSTQNLSYMSLTVHFMDNEWKMHKKIINFCQITGNSGHMIGKYVDDYLRS